MNHNEHRLTQDSVTGARLPRQELSSWIVPHNTEA